VGEVMMKELQRALNRKLKQPEDSVAIAEAVFSP
jgi:hypothetical protein